MIYEIKITQEAKTDLKSIQNYLLSIFLEEQLVENKMRKIKNAIQSLTYFPERNPIIKEKFLARRDVRRCVYDGYIIFYMVEKEKKIVHIFGITYARSNWMR